jgi:hypothetical protein
MAKNTEIRSVSIPIQLCEWVDTANIPLSEVLQLALWDKKRDWEQFNNDKEKLIKVLKYAQDRCQYLESFIDESDSREKFLSWNSAKKMQEKDVLV